MVHSSKSIFAFLLIGFLGVVSGCSDVHHSQREAVNELRALGGLVNLTSEKKAQEIHLGSKPVFDGDLVQLQGLDTIEFLDLSGTDVTDEGLAQIAHLSNLKKLNVGAGPLKGSSITDNGLVHLSGLQNLEQLVLSQSKITDAGLAHIASLRNLKELYIYQCNVTDEGLVHLESLQSLTILRAGATGITEEGFEAFLTKMPNLTTYSIP